MKKKLEKEIGLFRFIFENSKYLVYSYRLLPTHGFDYISPSSTNITGYEPDELYADPGIIFEILHPDNHQLIKSLKKNVSLNGKFISTRWIRKDGKIIWTEQLNKLIYDKEGKLVAIQGIARDITDTMQLKEELLQSQKLEEIGKFASSMVHDFNSILTNIMIYAKMLKMKHPDSLISEGEAINVILTEAERATNITHQLLNFARKTEYNPIPLNINNIIIDTIKISEKSFGKKIDVQYNFEDKINTIKADKNQIQLLLMNLIVNAKDAMPLGGKLVFETENIYIGEENVNIYENLQPGKYVKVSVIDTGIGMTKEIKEKIFDPFFTTKEIGKGSGLGLSNVYEIIKSYNGRIECDSEQSKGTTFTIFFPIFEEKEIDNEKIV